MNTPQPRQGKYCPQCSTMALPTAVRCNHCGHRFSTGMVAESPESLAEPLTEENLHRTRMFTLPPFLARPVVPAEDAPPTVLSDEELADLEKSLQAKRRAPSFWASGIAAVVILLALALWWWLAGRI